ncbi:hypothetical protein R3P38DRAFT_3206320 [Favolaschia claudopus]|uniref:Uncharacterized protein n=1 Tax=Favolaschia claudopus TaxID=2862362 RepID=A0AAW0AKZ4_9AGAR
MHELSSFPALSFSTPSLTHIYRYLIGFPPLPRIHYRRPPRPRLPIVVRPPAPCHRHPLSISLPPVSSLCDRYLHLSSHSLLLAFSSTILPGAPITDDTEGRRRTGAGPVLDAVDADTASVCLSVDVGGGIGVGRGRSPACVVSGISFGGALSTLPSVEGAGPSRSRQGRPNLWVAVGWVRDLWAMAPLASSMLIQTVLLDEATAKVLQVPLLSSMLIR